MNRATLIKPLVASTIALLAVPALAIPVDLELALLVDVSGSISTEEFNLQKNGYAAAFMDPSLQAVVANGRSFAATLVYWSDATAQSQVVGWTLVDSLASLASFSSAIGATTRTSAGGTEIGAAINFIVPQFATNGFESDRQVIDVSGDGTSTVATSRAARDAALAAGIDQINGLPIGGSAITNFYLQSVVGGTGSFVQASDTFADFNLAVATKIGREIVVIPSIPEPHTYALMLAGLAAVGAVARRRSAGGRQERSDRS